ncbi:CRIB domain-containing protein RIC4-like [Silene latifolia]|uniref:CRIB domain-containing protein RIC4-like n=1 Tax=Silene latifolia TaxID=37657 RepID=UPI003D780699
MKQRSERWSVFRYGFGCASGSSGAVDASGIQDKKQNELCIIKKTKHPLRLRLPNANLYHGFRRLLTSLKRVSRIFVYKIEMDEEENEGEMEIGYPTDVKHLTHIGWDGSTTVSKAGKQWENLTPSEIISFPSISLKQFELAMAQQADAAVNNNT